MQFCFVRVRFWFGSTLKLAAIYVCDIIPSASIQNIPHFNHQRLSHWTILCASQTPFSIRREDVEPIASFNHCNKIDNMMELTQAAVPSAAGTSSPVHSVQSPAPAPTVASGSNSTVSASDSSEMRCKKKDKTCTICNKLFARGSDLRVHMRTHSGEKPFSCSTCHKKFGKKSHLSRHEFLHTGAFSPCVL